MFFALSVTECVTFTHSTRYLLIYTIGFRQIATKALACPLDSYLSAAKAVTFFGVTHDD